MYIVTCICQTWRISSTPMDCFYTIPLSLERGRCPRGRSWKHRVTHRWALAAWKPSHVENVLPLNFSRGRARIIEVHDYKRSLFFHTIFYLPFENSLRLKIAFVFPNLNCIDRREQYSINYYNASKHSISLTDIIFEIVFLFLFFFL